MAHRIVDRGDRIRRLRNQTRGIGQSLAKHAPGILGVHRFAAKQRFQILAGGRDFREFDLAGRTIRAGIEIHRLGNLAATTAVDPIKSTLALATDIAVGDHFLDRRDLAVDLVERIAV